MKEEEKKPREGKKYLGNNKMNIGIEENRCVQCGSRLYSTNGYENDIIMFCCKLKCPNFGLLQLGSKNIFGILEYERKKNSEWVKTIEE